MIAGAIRRWVKPIHKDWNICDHCENFYVADTIRRQVKPIHKDWNICDLCENFNVADTIRRRVKPFHKDVGTLKKHIMYNSWRYQR